MKLKIVFILTVAFLSFPKVFANECSSLFEGPISASLFNGVALTNVRLQNSGEILRDVFSLITNAPNHSKVKIFTKNLRYDGVAALLLMTTIHESRKERGLRFEFYFENKNNMSRLHDLYAESSFNKIMFKDKDEPFSDKTLVIVEAPNETTYYEFAGSLMSLSLKDASRKSNIRVNYQGQNLLKASPFRDDIPTAKVIETTEKNQSSLGEELSELVKKYPDQHLPNIRMEEMDIYNINNRAYDLALQLYVHKNKKAPKEDMHALDILKAALTK